MSTETIRPAGLTFEQVAEFHERGFVKIGKLLDDDRVETLRREYDHEFDQAYLTGHYRNLARNETQDVVERNAASVKMLQIMQMCERNIHFRSLLYHKPILDLVESLLGPNIQLFHDQALFKPAHHGGAVFWHQDNAYWQCQPANLVSCWMTLDDADVHNGAMHLMPGSHRMAVTHDKSAETNLLFDMEKSVDPSKAVTVELPAGGALIHHCQTFHYTPPNLTDRQRRAFIIHFMNPGTRSMRTGEFIPVSFSNPMLRMRM
ncbi:MAG: phytanoyl-CoA dioxygenase family protein [candidate division Zixibacteria bacterium]|nr:phytanoyl-CoA dioxygenase family protein [candidate division Zixibacteria bacterium]